MLMFAWQHFVEHMWASTSSMWLTASMIVDIIFETRSYMAMSYKQTIGRFIPVNLGGDLNRGLAVFYILDPERI